MAERVVVDSSVAVAWFMTEGEYAIDAALGLLERHEQGELLLSAPSLLLLEVLSAAKSRRVDAVEVDMIASELLLLELALTDDRLLAQRAVVIASTYDLTVYDATFVALAAQLDCELVTADRRLAACTACRTRLL